MLNETAASRVRTNPRGLTCARRWRCGRRGAADAQPRAIQFDGALADALHEREIVDAAERAVFGAVVDDRARLGRADADEVARQGRHIGAVEVHDGRLRNR